MQATGHPRHVHAQRAMAASDANRSTIAKMGKNPSVRWEVVQVNSAVLLAEAASPAATLVATATTSNTPLTNLNTPARDLSPSLVIPPMATAAARHAAANKTGIFGPEPPAWQRTTEGGNKEGGTGEVFCRSAVHRSAAQHAYRVSEMYPFARDSAQIWNGLKPYLETFCNIPTSAARFEVPATFTSAPENSLMYCFSGGSGTGKTHGLFDLIVNRLSPYLQDLQDLGVLEGIEYRLVEVTGDLTDEGVDYGSMLLAEGQGKMQFGVQEQLMDIGQMYLNELAENKAKQEWQEEKEGEEEDEGKEEEEGNERETANKGAKRKGDRGGADIDVAAEGSDGLARSIRAPAALGPRLLPLPTVKDAIPFTPAPESLHDERLDVVKCQQCKYPFAHTHDPVPHADPSPKNLFTPKQRDAGNDDNTGQTQNAPNHASTLAAPAIDIPSTDSSVNKGKCKDKGKGKGKDKGKGKGPKKDRSREMRRPTCIWLDDLKTKQPVIPAAPFEILGVNNAVHDDILDELDLATRHDAGSEPSKGSVIFDAGAACIDGLVHSLGHVWTEVQSFLQLEATSLNDVSSRGQTVLELILMLGKESDRKLRLTFVDTPGDEPFVPSPDPTNGIAPTGLELDNTVANLSAEQRAKHNERIQAKQRKHAEKERKRIEIYNRRSGWVQGNLTPLVKDVVFYAISPQMNELDLFYLCHEKSVLALAVFPALRVQPIVHNIIYVSPSHQDHAVSTAVAALEAAGCLRVQISISRIPTMASCIPTLGSRIPSASMKSLSAGSRSTGVAVADQAEQSTAPSNGHRAEVLRRVLDTSTGETASTRLKSMKPRVSASTISADNKRVVSRGGDGVTRVNTSRAPSRLGVVTEDGSGAVTGIHPANTGIKGLAAATYRTGQARDPVPQSGGHTGASGIPLPKARRQSCSIAQPQLAAPTIASLSFDLAKKTTQAADAVAASRKAQQTTIMAGARVQEMAKQMRELRQQRDKARAQVEEKTATIGKLQIRVVSLEGELGRKEQEHGEMVSHLRGGLERSREARDVADRAKRDALGELEKALKEKDAVMDEVRLAVEQRDAAVVERIAAVEERGIAVEERDSAVKGREAALDLKEALAEKMGSAVDERDIAIAGQRAMRDKLAETAQQLEAVRTAMAAASTKSRDAQGQVLELKHELGRVRAQMEDVQRDKVQIEARCALSEQAGRDEAATAQTQVDGANERRERAEQDAKQVRAAMQAVTEDLETVRQAKERAEGRVRELEGRVKALLLAKEKEKDSSANLGFQTVSPTYAAGTVATGGQGSDQSDAPLDRQIVSNTYAAADIPRPTLDSGSVLARIMLESFNAGSYLNSESLTVDGLKNSAAGQHGRGQCLEGQFAFAMQVLEERYGS